MTDLDDWGDYRGRNSLGMRTRAQVLEVHGPERSRQVQEAIAMVGSLPNAELRDLAIFLRNEAKILAAMGRPEWGDTARAVAVLLVAMAEDDGRPR